MDGEIVRSDISIRSAHDIDQDLLYDFYKTMYPARAEMLIGNWKWLYRSSYHDNRIPIIMLYQDRVIAHAGMIPFDIALDGEPHSAAWLIDFAVLEEFQRQGLGRLIAKEWMAFSDLYCGIPNVKSLGALRKVGWLETQQQLHHYLLMPFDHPRFKRSVPIFLRRVFNDVTGFFLKRVYCQYASSVENLRLDSLNRETLDAFMAVLNTTDDTNTVVPVRDSDYVTWRLLQSPVRDRYRIARVTGESELRMILKMNDRQESRYIDVLWISHPRRATEIRNMLATLALWGMASEIPYIRQYVSNGELSNILTESLKSFNKKIKFIYFTRDTALLEKLKYSDWQWELIDSDLEVL